MHPGMRLSSVRRQPAQVYRYDQLNRLKQASPDARVSARGQYVYPALGLTWMSKVCRVPGP
jgi:hypothetical protein